MSASVALHSARAQRRASRRAAHHLVTADEHALTDLELFLAGLPLCATGRIFIEVADAADIGVIAAPPRMTVTWLARSAHSGATGSGRTCAPGQALTRAACAWADEMLCDDTATQVTLLGGYLGTVDILEHLTEVRGVPAASIQVPERFGLLPAER